MISTASATVAEPRMVMTLVVIISCAFIMGGQVFYYLKKWIG